MLFVGRCVSLAHRRCSHSLQVVTLFLTLDGILHPPGTLVDSNEIVRCTKMGAHPFQWNGALAKAIA